MCGLKNKEGEKLCQPLTNWYVRAVRATRASQSHQLLVTFTTLLRRKKLRLHHHKSVELLPVSVL